ncbi:hypothetical protein HMPREF0005_04489 [Achromobacter xylosoxidans C54]|nr:hypothetical protein HMPREF0005_04489 [Achromobacter xylosoxidans C54]
MASLDHIVTLPPLPLMSASALSVAPAATLTVEDLPLNAAEPSSGATPRLPSAISPPPAAPDTSMAAPRATLTCSPVTTTLPPRSPALAPVASTVPATLTVPASPPDSTILPFCVPTALALTMPSVLTTLSITPLTARAVIRTVPPSARITPLLATRAETGLPSASLGSSLTAEVASKLSRPSPWKSTVTVLAPARATRPSLASITPELRTAGATSTARPLSLMLIVPSLTIMALALDDGLSNLYLPARKSLSLMLAVVATRPPTSMRAPLPNSTPFGLTSITVPLAFRRPKMADGSLPTTRFSVMLLLPGWRKLTVSLAPMLKSFQLMIALPVDWLMSSVPLPRSLMVAPPATTLPPVGLAWAPPETSEPITIAMVVSAGRGGAFRDWRRADWARMRD